MPFREKENKERERESEREREREEREREREERERKTESPAGVVRIRKMLRVCGRCVRETSWRVMTWHRASRRPLSSSIVRRVDDTSDAADQTVDHAAGNRYSSELSIRNFAAEKSVISEIIRDPHLTFSQRRHNLASLAESMLPYPSLSKEAKELLDDKVICDLFEGPAPYRPRYTIPDYAVAIQSGSPYLDLPPPSDLEEAIHFLLNLYQYVPSITGYPVYIGDVDSLLEPFVLKELERRPRDEVKKSLSLFWRSIDRLFPDAFLHANLGPAMSHTAVLLLEVDRELKQTVPNLTLKYQPGVTPDELLSEGVRTCLVTAKPHFLNHPMAVSHLGPKYGVASCYNSLKCGGGAHTLVRLNLKKVGERIESDAETFLTRDLPHYISRTLEVIEQRIRFLVEQSRFFESHFLVKENLLRLQDFSAMFGIFGTAELVNEIMRRNGSTSRYGKNFEVTTLSHIHFPRMSSTTLFTHSSYSCVCVLSTRSLTLLLEGQ